MKSFRIIILLIGLIGFSPIYSQNTTALPDLKGVDIENLTDAQIGDFIKRIEESGMTMLEVENLAAARGIDAAQISKLKRRIELYKSTRTSDDKTNTTRDRVRTYNSDQEPGSKNKKILQGVEQTDLSIREKDIFSNLLKPDIKHVERPEDKVFGLKLFRNEQVSFEPSLNIPTPQNYLLGPGDNLIIDIWGVSEMTYTLQISPEGNVVIPNVGSVFLNGLTIELGIIKLKRELGKIYKGLIISSPNTFMNLSLGSVKSIKVNLVGEVAVPGTYTLPSLATVFNALYTSGGPSVNGSLRNIKLIRDKKTIANIDLYDFLLTGELKNDLNLRDQDIIFISTYKDRIEIDGEIKRPGFYEMNKDENLNDLIRFSAGFTEKAYESQLKVIRKTDKENQILDVMKENFGTFALQNGDKIIIGPVLDRFENRVEITGAVYRPGIYSLEKCGTLRELVKYADGIRGDAFPNRGEIYRQKEDMTLEILTFNQADILDESRPEIILKREDLVSIPSIWDINEDFTVNIYGDIRKPGSYPFIKNVKVEDLILQAGGLLESASLSRIEIARRIKDQLSLKTTNKIAEIYQFPISPDLTISKEASDFKLQPFDNVFVRRSPGYEEQKNVRLEGEVEFPGQYSLSGRKEYVSDLIKRAGGLTQYAYTSGARLIRQISSEDLKRKETLKKLALESGDSTSLQVEEKTENTIGIDLEKILLNPGSRFDITLQEGDRIVIPKELMTVKMDGAVLYSTTIRYQKNYRFGNYIRGAGGFADNAKKRAAYVIYANGSVDKTRSFLGIKDYPVVEPGSVIYIPVKLEKKGLSTAESIGILSATASMSLVIITLINALQTSSSTP